MFDNVPEWLAEKVLGIAADGGPQERGRIYYAAAGWTIAWYLKKNVRAPDAGEFFIPPGDVPSDELDSIWHAHINRTILIAETIFLLRNSPGFEEMRLRLVERDLRASFFEMLTAKQFLKAGFEVDARPPTFVKGQDFDFLAYRDTETIHVEVTAFEAGEYSERTVRNALNHKRSQLPTNNPALIFCVLPQRWFNGKMDFNAELSRVAANFLSGTGRINAVVFWGEESQSFRHGDGVPGAIYGLVRFPVLNANARLPIELPFLFEGRRSEEMRRAVTTGVGLNNLIEESYDSEFFHWIDSVIRPSQD